MMLSTKLSTLLLLTALTAAAQKTGAKQPIGKSDALHDLSAQLEGLSHRVTQVIEAQDCHRKADARVYQDKGMDMVFTTGHRPFDKFPP